MKKYTLAGEYPDGTAFHAKVEVKDCEDAIAMGQGLRVVTTLKRISVHQDGWPFPLWEDSTQHIK